MKKAKSFFIARKENKEVKEILQARSKAINELKNLNKKLTQNYWQKEMTLVFYTRKIQQGGKRNMQKKLHKKRNFYKNLAAFAAMFLLGSFFTTVFSFTVSLIIGITLFVFAFMIFDDLDYTVKNK